MVQYTGEAKLHWLKIDVGSKELLMTVSQRRGPKDHGAAAAVVVARAAAACTRSNRSWLENFNNGTKERSACIACFYPLFLRKKFTA